jgi:hypothetical protein
MLTKASMALKFTSARDALPARESEPAGRSSRSPRMTSFGCRMKVEE